MTEAVALLDSALHRHLVDFGRLHDWAISHAGYRGVRRLKRALGLADPAAESVMETRLRLLLVLAGLPHPKVQVSLRDDCGLFLARPDLYYPDARLAIEYDGATHRASLAADNRRQNRLIDAGYRILRFTAGDVLDDPSSVVSMLRRALAVSDVADSTRPELLGHALEMQQVILSGRIADPDVILQSLPSAVDGTVRSPTSTSGGELDGLHPRPSSR